ncbi:MAG TPA: type II toxin-antitoxin system VapC family toxin [Frankiaceae bacterium]|jgi:predicted nucleic acid-binding protein|nr:type II toxin-antitoxin system VapC family toxin [Frankiaceae bacterium]
MQEVLDANVVLKWWAPDEEGAERARNFRIARAAGWIEIVVPRVFSLEVLNIAGRKWRWAAGDLATLGARLDEPAFTYRDPSSSHVARWVAAGLTAYDASYVALAESIGRRVVTTDRQMLRVAPDLTTPLVP